MNPYERNLPMKKFIKVAAGAYLAYLGYCFTRGLVWGATHPNATEDERRIYANKVARFQG
jgi:threonine/homoserine/homoserine lactone efflux protein